MSRGYNTYRLFFYKKKPKGIFDFFFEVQTYKKDIENFISDFIGEHENKIF